MSEGTTALRCRVPSSRNSRLRGRLILSCPRALASAKQTLGYFLHEYLARNYSSHCSAGRWHGSEAEAPGLGQRVGTRRIISILSGHVPDTEVTLGRVIDGERRYRPGWVMTISASQSVSLEALDLGRRAVRRRADSLYGWRPKSGWLRIPETQIRAS